MTTDAPTDTRLPWSDDYGPESMHDVAYALFMGYAPSDGDRDYCDDLATIAHALADSEAMPYNYAWPMYRLAEELAEIADDVAMTPDHASKYAGPMLALAMVTTLTLCDCEER